MRLHDLLNGIEHESYSYDFEIHGVTDDSRKVKKGYAFVAVMGYENDGHKYIADAYRNGAVVVISQRKVKNGNYVLVKNTRKILHKLATNFYGNPQENLKIVAVTGTNGKTTITSLLHHIFKNSTLIGTIKNEILSESISTENTTPGQLELMRIFKESVKKNVEYVFMEVSSHSIAQKRIEGLKFDYVVITNITQDHLDFHKSFEEYKNTKLSLIDYLKEDGKLLINSSVAEYKNYNCITYGFEGDYFYKVLKANLEGSLISIFENGKEKARLSTKLIGNFNYENILAAYIVAINEGMNIEALNSSISSFEPVDGRFNVIRKFNRTIIVDFAHSPDALMNSIKSARSFTKGKLIVVFGAGGHADALKRPIMGEVAVKNADVVIVTNDNPYYENEYLILTQILHGINEGNIYVIPNRYMAIEKALKIQREDDIVLICGKGHERFIIYDDRLIPFYDKDVVERILNDIHGKSNN